MVHIVTPEAQGPMARGILKPCVVWLCLGACLLAFSGTCQAARRRLRICARFGSTTFRDFWSTFLVFAVVVPMLQIVILLTVGGLLAVLEGWSFSGGFHYHAFMLGLTSVNLGEAQAPTSMLSLLPNMYATLTGSISSYVALYIAAMTAVTRNVAELAPDGFKGLLIAIFLCYPALVMCTAHIIGAIMCGIEGWDYLDSFLLACSWLSAVPLKITGCKISSEITTFLVFLCKTVAVAMKITVLDLIYFNTFPRKVVDWIDTWVAQEEDTASVDFQAVCQRDLYKLEEECAALELENERLREGNARLQKRVAVSGHDKPDSPWRGFTCFSARSARGREAMNSDAGPVTLYGAAGVSLPRCPEMQQCYPQELASVRGSPREPESTDVS